MRPTLIALALAASLFAYPASPAFLLEQLSSLLQQQGNEAHSKEGCGADPYGLCSPARQTTAEAGCGAGRSGQCITRSVSPAAEPEAGCGMDPYGCP